MFRRSSAPISCSRMDAIDAFTSRQLDAAKICCADRWVPNPEFCSTGFACSLLVDACGLELKRCESNCVKLTNHSKPFVSQ